MFYPVKQIVTTLDDAQNRNLDKRNVVQRLRKHCNSRVFDFSATLRVGNYDPRMALRLSRLHILTRNIFALTVLTLIIFITGCDIQVKKTSLIEEYIINKMEIGSVVKINSMGVNAAEKVCILGPYQSKVYEEIPERQKINDYLHQIGYLDPGDNWTLVMVTKTSIDLIRVWEGNAHYFNLFLGFDLSPPPPDNFETVGCASYEHAAIFKSQVDGLDGLGERVKRVNYVFGRTE